MSTPLYLALTLLLAALTLRAVWRNSLALGCGAAICFSLFYLPLPPEIHPWLIVAWLLAVWPQRLT